MIEIIHTAEPLSKIKIAELQKSLKGPYKPEVDLDFVDVSSEDLPV